MQKSAHLTSRSIIAISGEDAVGFLQNLVTCDIEHLQEGETAFGALLTPQGKILFDFLIHKSGDGFLADLNSDQVDDFARRMIFYRLRAKVNIERLDETVSVTWPAAEGDRFCDPRTTKLGARQLGEAEANSTEKEWNQHRIGCGIPGCEADFLAGEVFPHEALMDHFGSSGVDFSKGCYVGQEVVSRMQHRGTARSRFVKLSAPGGDELPIPGTEIEASGRKIGKMGSHAGPVGLALVRLDRAASSMRDGQEISAGGILVQPALPEFVNFDWPQ